MNVTARKKRACQTTSMWHIIRGQAAAMELMQKHIEELHEELARTRQQVRGCDVERTMTSVGATKEPFKFKFELGSDF